MSQTLNIKSITRSTSQLMRTIGTFHYGILLCLIIGSMGFTLYYINTILNNPPSSTTTEIGFSDQFDSETITTIDKFKYRDETKLPAQPSGRTNPFTEKP